MGLSPNHPQHAPGQGDKDTVHFQGLYGGEFVGGVPGYFNPFELAVQDNAGFDFQEPVSYDLLD